MFVSRMSSLRTGLFVMGSEEAQAHPKLWVKGKRYSETLAVEQMLKRWVADSACFSQCLPGNLRGPQTPTSLFVPKTL